MKFLICMYIITRYTLNSLTKIQCNNSNNMIRKTSLNHLTCHVICTGTLKLYKYIITICNRPLRVGIVEFKI